MLFRRMNNCCPADGEDASEVVKVPCSPSHIRPLLHSNVVDQKYINTVLKVDFDLDTTSKPKPVVGPDDLLLLLV